MNGRDAADGGFTPLEVMVALVILVAGLAGYYFAFGSGLVASASAERSWRAAQAAESLVAQLGRSIPIAHEVQSGEFPDRRRWKVQLTPFEPADTSEHASQLAARIATVAAPKRTGTSKAIRLETLVIGIEPK